MENLPSSTNGTAAPAKSPKEQDVTTSSSSSKPETEAQTSKEETATPGSPKPMTKEQATEKAMSLLVQGRRHLLVSDVPNAIAALAESSELLGEHYGESADECAESYYYYGMALLEMARLDPDVLGDAVEGGEKGEDASDDDDEEGEDEDDDDEEESNEEVSSKTNTGVEDVEMKEAEKKEKQNKEETGEDKAAVKPKNEGKGKALKVVDSLEPQLEKSTEEETEDVTNLQLAWEVLELSKSIYKRQVETNSAVKPKLADTLVRLAEVAIESENYTSAIEDLLSCLEIQTSTFPSDSRSLAETRYQLGVAYTFTTEFKEAIDNFETAVRIIKQRIENLKNPKEKTASNEEPKHLFYTVEGEIEELESLLPDIKEKIADTIDLEKEAAKKVAEIGASGAGTSSEPIGEVSVGFEAAGSSNGHDVPSSSKPALDITHLIRKKRKPDGTEAEAASPAKKVCADSSAV